MSTVRVLDSRSARPPDDIEAAAAYWLARRRLQLLSPTEELEFEAWRAQPAHSAAYAAAENVIERSGAAAEDSEIRSMRAAALMLGQKRRMPAQFPWRAAAAAVAAVVILAGVWVEHSSVDLATSPQLISRVVPIEGNAMSVQAVRRYSTQIGERTPVTLEDGSTAFLNTASSIEVAFTDERREVRLLQGQALFEVAKDARRPFIVSAGDRFVTALGTTFDVRIDAGRVDVVVIEGRVAVDPVRHTGLGRFIPALARREVHPGEELTSVGDRTASVAAADVERITSWRHGQVIFRDDTVTAAVTEMNRYSPRPIIVTDPRVGNLRISGVFGLRRPENFVAAIVAHYPVDAQRDARDATVLSWRDVSPHPPQE